MIKFVDAHRNTLDLKTVPNATKAAQMKSLMGSLAGQLENARCPVHGEGSVVIEIVGSPNRVEGHVRSGCCDEMMALAKETIGD